MKYRNPPEISNSLDQLLARSNGRPIKKSILRRMESRFGRSFGSVRIHDGPAAAEAAGFLNARAFTIGRNIFFSNRLYDPDSSRGLWLLAHELAHVVQQSRRSAGEVLPENVLENRADLAADLVAIGKRLDPGFLFGKAEAGSIQCHSGPRCRGIPVPASDKAVWLAANELIEGVYKMDPRTGGPTGWVIFGSQFETGRDIAPPHGFPNKKFANFLLRNLRGIRNQRRPDIIDFKNRVFYEIKTVGFAGKGDIQVESYYKVTETLRVTEFPSEPPWNIEYARWYPPHEIPMPPKMIVCTQATDHDKNPALLLYDVRLLGEDEEEKKQHRMVVDQRVTEFDNGFNELYERMRMEMRNKIRTYDPEYPEYVIIVPRRFYIQWYEQNVPDIVDKMAPGIPPFLNPKTVVGRFHRIGWMMVGMTAAAYACLIIGVLAIDAIPMGAGIAAEGIAVEGAAAEAVADVVVLNTARTVATSAAAQNLAKAAGVIFVIGVASNAKGATPKVEDVSAIRVVPLSSLRTQGNSVIGFSKDFGYSTSIYDLTNPDSSIPVDVAKGSVINYNHEPHIVIGKMIAY